ARVRYVLENPKKAGLVRGFEEWPGFIAVAGMCDDDEPGAERLVDPSGGGWVVDPSGGGWVPKDWWILAAAGGS
ncbi:MAG: hypothetical protein KF901_31460, partial [Myxococcales bacterium]|nr:hypothetical protein [Myxococcales bacterium]